MLFPSFSLWRLIRLWVLFVCILGACDAGIARAAEDFENPDAGTSDSGFFLDEIVVSASKVQEPLRAVPKHVTVISGEEIRESTGRDVIDLLAKQSGITVRSNSGTDKHAVVDLRGMGDTAVSNVIVMVDDVLLNAPDLSGPSISSIPVEQIERIEIVRGAGSVVYGSGAVGGVINIITKKAGKTRSANLYSAYGSYDTIDTQASFEDTVRGLGFRLNAGWYDSDGYRDNGFLEKTDIGANVRYPVHERLTLLLSGTYYADEYGLPGPVSREDIDSRTRRVRTDRPDDSGESTEFRGRAGAEIDLGRWGGLTLKRGYRDRENLFVMGYNPQIPRGDQETDIDEDTRTIDINYVKEYSIFELPQKLQIGFDHYKTEYIREQMQAGPRQNSETESFGLFINNQWALTTQLLLNAGARYDEYEGHFRTDMRQYFDSTGEWFWINGDVTRKKWDNTAYTLGLTYSFDDDSTVFASFSTSFRIPNVDEFAEAEKGLGPQEGDHIEIGGRKRFGDFLDLNLALFDIRIDDEIYYSQINRNYDDRTIRRGIEIDFRLYPSEDLSLWGSYTYTRARFDRRDTTVPLVPEHTASAGIEWQPIRNFRMYLSGTYSGSRYDGDDIENNLYAKLDDYVVFDAKVSYLYKNIDVFLGVENIFNELYVTSGYSEGYYPMPERNVFGGFRWKFL